MKLEVGMYIRFKDKNGVQYIRKIVDLPEDTRYGAIRIDKDSHNVKWVSKKNVLKVSENIIDLIEVGDYVNGERVIALRKDIPERYIHMNSKDNFIFVEYDLANNWYYGIDTDKIKTIVTKEQFENMAYKIEKE